MSSKLKQWATGRWMFSGHVAAALKMIMWHRKNTGLSPAEEKSLDKIESELYSIQENWDESSIITKLETLEEKGTVYSKRKRLPDLFPPSPCIEEGHDYRKVKTKRTVKTVKHVCTRCGKVYYDYPKNIASDKTISAIENQRRHLKVVKGGK